MLSFLIYRAERMPLQSYVRQQSSNFNSGGHALMLAAYALAAKRRALQKLAQAQARAGDAQEVAKRVIDLIQATIALSREQTEHEAALQRIHIAAKIVTGAIPPDMYANASVTERSAAAR
jgi:hypothetical protein